VETIIRVQLKNIKDTTNTNKNTDSILNYNFLLLNAVLIIPDITGKMAMLDPLKDTKT
jgi:hypothetical protein